MSILSGLSKKKSFDEGNWHNEIRFVNGAPASEEDLSEIITHVWYYKSPISNLTYSDGSVQDYMGSILYHAFIIIKTNDLYWSVEKHDVGISMQRSNKLDEVKYKFCNNTRGKVELLKEEKNTKCSLKDLMNKIRDKEVNKVYNLNFEHNCQGFAERIYSLVKENDSMKIDFRYDQIQFINGADFPQRDLSEIITHVWLYQSQISYFRCSDELQKHSFIIGKTENWFWSIEKYDAGVVVQRSFRMDEVRSRFNNFSRGTVDLLKMEKNTKCSMEDLINSIKSRGRDNFIRSTNNCQRFSEEVFHRIIVHNSQQMGIWDQRIFIVLLIALLLIYICFIW